MYDPRNMLKKEKEYLVFPKYFFFEPGNYFLFYMYEIHQDTDQKFLFQMIIPFLDFLDSKDREETIRIYDHEIVFVDKEGEFLRSQGLPYMPNEDLLLLKLPGYYEIGEPQILMEYMQTPFDFSSLELNLGK